jgi:hypothetical protein
MLIGDVTASGNTSGNITTTLSNTTVTAGTYGDAGNIPQITVDSKGRVTAAGNIAVTIPPGFAGNLAGNSLYDTTHNRVLVQANPISPFNSSGDWGGLINNTPTYTSGILNQNNVQTITAGFQSNVQLASASGNKTAAGLSSLAQFNLTAGLSSNNRTRAAEFINEIFTNGHDYGHDGNGIRPTIAGAQIGTQIFGTGNVGSTIGLFNFVGVDTTTADSNNYQFLTGTQTNINSPSIPTSSTVDYARLLTGVIVDNTGSGNGFSITNAIGLHIMNGWTSQINTVTNKYAVLSEDVGTAISIKGPIVTTQTMTVGNYASTALPTGSVGMMIAINDNGGKLAYWDTTNTRWSYVFDNSAV